MEEARGKIAGTEIAERFLMARAEREPARISAGLDASAGRQRGRPHFLRVF
jgi:hypothetical protein